MGYFRRQSAGQAKSPQKTVMVNSNTAVQGIKSEGASKTSRKSAASRFDEAITMSPRSRKSKYTDDPDWIVPGVSPKKQRVCYIQCQALSVV